MKNIKTRLLSLAIGIIVGLAAIAYVNAAGGSTNFGGTYSTKKETAKAVLITDKLNVREDPLASVQTYTEYAGTQAGAAGWGVDTKDVKNSFGKTKIDLKNDEVAAIAVFAVYYPKNCSWDDCCKDLVGDTANGPFIGLSVEDIQKNANWKKIFPKGIEKDVDGIVWVSTKWKTVEIVK